MSNENRSVWISGLALAVAVVVFFNFEKIPGLGPSFVIPVDENAGDDGTGVWRAQVETIMADTTEVWTAKLAEAGTHYTPPRYDTFFDKTADMCGTGVPASLPVYCIGARRLAIQTGAFQGYARRHYLLGELIVTYAIAHMVGHHVQAMQGHLTGQDQSDGSDRHIRLELQADCYAGIWLAEAEPRFGEIADRHIGQMLSATDPGGDVDSDWHGRPGYLAETFRGARLEQRERWLRKGYTSGDLAACDALTAEIL